MKMTKEFNEAALYTCSDDEYVTQTCWAEAIREELEGDWEKDETVKEQCERIGEVTVTAYNLGMISTSWIAGQVERILEKFHDNFSEEYGCAEHPAEPWTEETLDWTKKVLTSNLTKSLRSATTHNIEPAGTHTFSVEECIEMMK